MNLKQRDQKISLLFSWAEIWYDGGKVLKGENIMLDNRVETFLALCEIMNYTKTAETLHITQPAVTQQIRWLEEYYGCFPTKGKFCA